MQIFFDKYVDKKKYPVLPAFILINDVFDIKISGFWVYLTPTQEIGHILNTLLFIYISSPQIFAANFDDFWEFRAESSVN